MGDLFSFLFLRTTNLYAMFAYPIGRIYTNVSLTFTTLFPQLKSLSDASGHPERPRSSEERPSYC